MQMQVVISYHRLSRGFCRLPTLLQRSTCCLQLQTLFLLSGTVFTCFTCWFVAPLRICEVQFATLRICGLQALTTCVIVNRLL